MSEEKKDECCSTHGSGCCGGKKLIIGILIGIGLFVAGMLFAKSCPLAKGGCPFTAQQK